MANDVSVLKPYCFAADELGSRGLPDRVYPSPVSLTFAGKGLPWRQSLMKYFCACDVNERASLVPTCSAHFFQSLPCRTNASRNFTSSCSSQARALARSLPASLRLRLPVSVNSSSPVGSRGRLGSLGALGSFGGLGSFGALTGFAAGFFFFFFLRLRP